MNKNSPCNLARWKDISFSSSFRDYSYGVSKENRMRTNKAKNDIREKKPHDVNSSK